MQQKPLDRSKFNIDLLIPDKDYFKQNNLKEVTTLAIFETNSNVFHSEGLYSVEIFGPVGSPERLKRHGYIDFKVPILHPMVYSSIIKLGKKYEKILSGTGYGYFDKTTKDFVIDESNENSRTGYEFFISYIDQIVYGTTESKKRDYKIALVDKYGRSNGLYTTTLVLPAGLRDYTVDDKGTPSEDEVNDKYRLLIGLANRVNNFHLTKENIHLLDPIRYKIQRVLLDIYLYFKGIIDGKNKFIQSKWASRGVDYATANVITATPILINDLEQTNKITCNHTVIGLYQYLKSIGTLVVNKINSYFLYDIVSETQIRLINPKTLESENVELSTKTRTAWLTTEGLNGVVNKLQQDTIKDSPVLLDGYYMAVIHEREDGIHVYTNSDDIPPEVPRKELRPITYGELFYIAIIDVADVYPSLNTRYPITGAGSIYPVYNFVKVTVEGKEIDVHIAGTILRAKWYPIKGSKYFRSQSPHYTHLEALGADFDGDRNSSITLFSKESIAEVEKLLNSKEYYLDPVKGLQYSIQITPINLAIQHLTDSPVSGVVKGENANIEETTLEENNDKLYLLIDQNNMDALELKAVFENFEDEWELENMAVIEIPMGLLEGMPFTLRGTPLAVDFKKKNKEILEKNYKILYPQAKQKELDLLIEADITKISKEKDKSYMPITYKQLLEVLSKDEYISYKSSISYAEISLENNGKIVMEEVPHLLIQLNEPLKDTLSKIEGSVNKLAEDGVTYENVTTGFLKLWDSPRPAGDPGHDGMISGLAKETTGLVFALGFGILRGVFKGFGWLGKKLIYNPLKRRAIAMKDKIKSKLVRISDQINDQIDEL